jgi:hypothetical protein
VISSSRSSFFAFFSSGSECRASLALAVRLREADVGITAEKLLHFLEGMFVVCEQLSDR